MKKALKAYRNPIYTKQEFLEDYRRIKLFVKCFEKYPLDENFPVRLAFNHFAISCNCFGVDYVISTFDDIDQSIKESINEFLLILGGQNPTNEFGSFVQSQLRNVL